MTIRFTLLDDYIPYVGESWGLSWGNVISNSPNPELWTVNHQSPASLYETRTNSVRNITQAYFGRRVGGDLHGAAWADFDNDGDQDLIQLVASDFGGSVTQLYVNQDGQLRNQASQLGVADPLPGRSPLWLDYNRDGRLDLLVNGRTGNGVGPTVFRQNNRGEFINDNERTGFSTRSTRYAQISDLTGDGRPEVLINGGQEIYEFTGGKFVDRSSRILRQQQIRGARDAIAADFNNDLEPDLWITRRGSGSQTVEVGNRELRSYWETSSDQSVVGTQFQTGGRVTFTVPFYDVSDIFIGGQQVNPAETTFSLSSTDARLQGGETAPAQGDGVYINYDRATRMWTIELVGAGASPTYGFVNSSQRIQSWQTLGFRNDSLARSNQLWVNQSGRLSNQSQEAGLTADNARISGRNAVAGDFDNDGDQDVYVLATGVAGNLPNRLYRNNGNGEFTVVNNAWGASGTLLGLGDAVTTVDINNDGFLDLTTVNGAFFSGTGNVSREFYNDAPYEVFINQGNDNRWLLVELEGRITNRDGIGSSVIARANLTPNQGQGVTSQLREQNGGVHSGAQNDSRLHFGLGQARRVESLEINWLSGIQQTHFNVASNQQFRAIEGRGSTGKDFFSGRASADRLVGLRGNDELNGNAGRDQLIAGGGRDLLIGGAGADTLTGGAGRDRFRYENWRHGRDLITDFTVGEDTIEIQRRTFLPDLPSGDLPNAYFVLGATARRDHAQFLYQANQGILSFDPDGTGNRRARVLAEFTDAPRIRAAQISVV